MLFITVTSRKTSAKTHSDKRDKHKQHSRVRLYSMLVTIALLLVILIGSYAALQTRVEDLPATVPFQYAEWMVFVPDSAQFVGYVNYRACMDTTGNYSLFGNDPLLEMYLPPFTLYAQSIEYEASVNLPARTAKEASPTVNIIKIALQDLNALQRTLESSTILHRTHHGTSVIYDLLVLHKRQNPQLVPASLAVADEHIVLSEGTGTASSVGTVLDAAASESHRLFSLESARKALYAAGGSSGGYLALFMATFPTQIEGANIMMKTVKSTSTVVTIQMALSFDNQDKARAQYNAVKRLYTGGSDYWILGQFVVAKFDHDISELRQDVRGL
jgi:hypothetical protein